MNVSAITTMITDCSWGGSVRYLLGRGRVSLSKTSSSPWYWSSVGTGGGNELRRWNSWKLSSYHQALEGVEISRDIIVTLTSLTDIVKLSYISRERSSFEILFIHFAIVVRGDVFKDATGRTTAITTEHVRIVLNNNNIFRTLFEIVVVFAYGAGSVMILDLFTLEEFIVLHISDEVTCCRTRNCSAVTIRVSYS